MSAADPVRRSQIAALGADASWAKTADWPGRTAAARQARRRKFEDQVDPQRELDSVTRARKADKAEKAAMRVMSRKGVLTRRRNTCARLIGQPVSLLLAGEPVSAVLAAVQDDTVTLLDPAGEEFSARLDQISSVRAARRAKRPAA